jgi:hypothetical protein
VPTRAAGENILFLEMFISSAASDARTELNITVIYKLVNNLRKSATGRITL